MGMDTYPWANPRLPYQLDVGESVSWVYDLAMLRTMIRFFRQRGAVIDSIVGVITLGSGESIDSEVLAAALLEPTSEVA